MSEKRKRRTKRVDRDLLALAGHIAGGVVTLGSGYVQGSDPHYEAMAAEAVNLARAVLRRLRAGT